jgi:hypothetical protein
MKLVDQCHSKQVLEYVRQHCPRSISGTDASTAGKGKKVKKKKEHANSNNIPENVSNSANHVVM